MKAACVLGRAGTFGHDQRMPISFASFLCLTSFETSNMNNVRDSGMKRCAVNSFLKLFFVGTLYIIHNRSKGYKVVHATTVYKDYYSAQIISCGSNFY